MRKTSGPGPVSPVEKLEAGTARSARAGREEGTISPGTGWLGQDYSHSEPTSLLILGITFTRTYPSLT